MSATLRFTTLTLLASCATTAPVTAGPTTSAPTAAATFDGQTVSVSEVDARTRKELQKLEQRRFELRADAAERLAVERMIETEAAAEHQSEEQWLMQRIGPLAEPTDEALRSAWAQVRSRWPEGASFEDAREQLKAALQKEQRVSRMGALVESLKKTHHYRLMLPMPEQPRKQVSSLGPSRGPADAPVVIVEFADFQCPYCSRAADTLEKVREAWPTQVRVVFRHYPLSFHALAPPAARAAICADAQNRFWPVHDALFAGSASLDDSGLRAAAQTAGVDMKTWETCLGAPETSRRLEADKHEGTALGVDGTPAFFVNGIMLSGARPESDFRRLIEAELQRLGR